MEILAASRYAYGRSVTQGKTVRILLDFEAGTLALEEAHGSVTLARTVRKNQDEEEDDAGSIDPWESARSKLSTTLDPTAYTSPFSPITGSDGSALKKYKPHSLGSGVEVRRMILPHRQDPVTEGQDALYFFPGGFNDRAVVELAYDDTVYSVEIFPLSGDGRVRPGSISERDLEESEVEDPGP